MTNTPTPGPWAACQARDSHGQTIDYWHLMAGQIQIADFFGLTGEETEDGDDATLPPEEIRANAQLAAAAPTMLAALEEVQPMFEAMSMKADALRFTFKIDGRDTAIEVDLKSVADLLQTIIAKARGEANLPAGKKTPAEN